MSDSPLASQTILSPNTYGARKQPILGAAVHYMCWYCTAETCAESFMPTSRHASANYMIGKYGDIVLGVPEDEAAGTTSSEYCDQRCITIECANHMETADGHVYGQLPDATWHSLVALLADICERNGKTRVVYTGEANFDSARSGELLLVKHRWFDDTDCPGPWLDGQFDRLAAEANTLLHGGRPLLTVRQALAECMLHLVTHDAHGYSQPAREGDGAMETVTLSDGTPVRLPGGDKDCSEAIRACLAGLGLVAFGYWESYMWTGNEDEVLRGAGFTEVPLSQAGEGDVLWMPGHTEMCVAVGGKLMDAGFRRSETGGIDGEPGDQTGAESMYSAHPAYAWERCYRYAGPEREGAGKIVDGTENGQTEDEMICIITPNDKSYQMYFDGARLHPLGHPDEAEALNKVYQATHGGKSIPGVKLGTKNAPWATRLADALARTTTKV